jgi:hypothetical protein
VSWLLFLGAIALIALIRKKVKLSSTAGAIVIDIVIALLVLVAGASFFEIWPGQIISDLFAGTIGFFGLPVATTAAVLALIATVVFFADVKDKHLNGPAIGALFVLPGLVLLFSGPLAAFWASAGDGAQSIVMSGLSGIGG